MKINPLELKIKIQNLMLEYPELQDDEDLRLTTLEGETELFEVLAIIVDDIKSARSMVDAIENRRVELKARRERFEQKELGWRKLVKELMDKASFRKVTLPEATLSIRAGQPSVQIIEPALIPKEFWRIKREPDISLIRKALKDHEPVPGTTLNNSPDQLAILSK